MRRRYRQEIGSYIPNLPPFDDLLRSHGGIISGATALHFFQPDVTWQPRELDINLPSNTYRSFLRAVADPDTFNWSRIPGFRQKTHTSARHPSVFRFIGGGVDETEYEADDFLDPDEVLAYVRPPTRCGCGETHSTPPSRHSQTPVAATDDSGSRCSDDSGTDDDSLRADPSSDSDEGDGNFFHPEDEALTDSYIQLEFYSPDVPSLVHGKGFPTMRSFRTPCNRRVNVIRSHSINPVSPLRHFWATIMTNFITPDRCVCAFPTGTLSRRGAPRVEPLCLREQAALEEYERRGFVIDKSMRDELDVWEYMFFGEQALLHMSFRKSANESDGVPLPIRQTTRGWVTDDSWSVDPPGDLYYPSMSMGCSPISIARSTPLTIAQRE